MRSYCGQRSFLSLLNEVPDEVELHDYDFGTDATPQTRAELHNFVTNMFLSHFWAQRTPCGQVAMMAIFSGKTSLRLLYW